MITSMSWSMRASCGVSGFGWRAFQKCVSPLDRQTFWPMPGSGGTPVCKPSKAASYWKSSRRFVMSVLKSTGVNSTRMPTLARSSRMKLAMPTRSRLSLLVLSVKLTVRPCASSSTPSPSRSRQLRLASSRFASSGL